MSLNLTPRLKYTDHDKEVIEKSKELIKEGKTRPILVDSNDLKRVIDGNHTLAAYQELGMEPPLIYVASQEDFRRVVVDTLLLNNTNMITNQSLAGLYRMIEEGIAKKLEDIESDTK